MTPYVDVPAPIGVLCGGPSAEREISLRSGRAVWRALRDSAYDAQLIDIRDADCLEQLRASGIRTAFIALHGPFGEDGTIQAILESLGLSYTGSGVETSRRAIDKAAARERFRDVGLSVARGLTIPTGAVPGIDGFGFPMVVKPARQGSSFGLTLVGSPGQWLSAVELARRYDSVVICEEYLQGPELTVGIVDDRPLPVIQIVPRRPFYDYVAKYTQGMTQYLVPAPLDGATTRQVQSVAMRAHRALGCRGFSRVDIILSQDRGPCVLEVNTIPGLTELSLLPMAAAAAGLSFAQLCERLLTTAAQWKECVHGTT